MSCYQEIVDLPKINGLKHDSELKMRYKGRLGSFEVYEPRLLSPCDSVIYHLQLCYSSFLCFERSHQFPHSSCDISVSPKSPILYPQLTDYHRVLLISSISPRQSVLVIRIQSPERQVRWIMYLNLFSPVRMMLQFSQQLSACSGAPFLFFVMTPSYHHSSLFWPTSSVLHGG